ncbi:metal ABC transporter solute-binding protein, Zn/Mn family [Simkania negevensis]|uniref:Uncharacterized metal-binding lipoprotein TC_0338 n=1 Tax=Simkania negevensis (strain ATCC VR-1471 / DSM 27360 / Z) TaxID=331113 RepID=F8L6P1_SIMNZ|nr:zinc ABC transporter substrate-binding protein [Simkania negevensis]CCB88389.1 uncharacterized metal-binding lipoprotein TC_0338 [Simkania negevensis Z]
MKKLFALGALAFLMFVGCSKGPKQNLNQWMAQDGRLKVLSTTAMIEDVVKQVGGEEICSLCLIVGDLDPHSYELIKGDDEKLQTADLIFYNGVGLEHGASIRYYFTHDSKAVAVGDTLLQRFPDRLVRVGGELDPHIWMDMDLFSEIVDPIVVALSEKAPTKKELFQERGHRVKEELKAKDRLFRETMSEVPPEKRFLVTSHDAFHYFTKRYLALEEEEDWERRVQAPEGLAPDGQMSVFDIQKVTDFLCENQVHVVFPESNVSRDSLRKIVHVCKKRGLDVHIADVPLYGDTMAGANSYVEMMEHNVNTLKSHMLREDEQTSSR